MSVRARLSRGALVVAAAVAQVCAALATGAAAGPDPWANEEPGAVIPAAGVAGTFADARPANAEGMALRTPLGHSRDVAFVEGDVYLVEVRRDDRWLRVLRPDGTTEVIPGSGDGELAAGALEFVAAGPNHTLYLANTFEVSQMSPDGQETIVAGNATSPIPASDGALATEGLMAIADIASDKHGVLYIAEQSGGIFRVEGDGTLTAVVDADVLPIWPGTRIAVGADGVVYVAYLGRHRVAAVARDGSVDTFAGTGDASDLSAISDPAETGDGDPATEVPISSPRGVAVDADGNVYLSTSDGLRWVDRAGTFHAPTEVDGDGDGVVHRPYGDLAVDAHANVYVTDLSGSRLWVVVAPRSASGLGHDLSEPMIPWGIAVIFGAPFVILAASVLLVLGGLIYLRRRRRRAATGGSV